MIRASTNLHTQPGGIQVTALTPGSTFLLFFFILNLLLRLNKFPPGVNYFHNIYFGQLKLNGSLILIPDSENLRLLPLPLSSCGGAQAAIFQVGLHLVEGIKVG